MTILNIPNPTVQLGTSLLLRCRAGAPRPVTFSWAINGNPVNEGGRSVVTSDPSSMESILNITSVLEGDLGVVLCIVSDPLHPPLMGSLSIAETGQLYLFGNRDSVTHKVQEGTAIRLECPIRASSPATSVKWFMGTLLLVNRSGVTLYRLPNGSAVAELGVASVAGDDGDLYECEVKEGAITLLYQITIFVTSKEGMTWSQLRCVLTWQFLSNRVPIPSSSPFLSPFPLFPLLPSLPPKLLATSPVTLPSSPT